jgi:hypothetical protein
VLVNNNLKKQVVISMFGNIDIAALILSNSKSHVRSSGEYFMLRRDDLIDKK